ncbi:MAG: hypothetical protein JXR76_09850, partial [Deltaproteobacteria bacterium]|nr:hypothetical protein [Deltaproteobacteria bacterium]
MSGTPAVLTSQAARVFGFEDATADWTQISGASTEHSEGTVSGAVNVTGWMQITSVPLSSIAQEGIAIGGSAVIDVKLPEAASWGEVRLIMDLPSQSIWWKDLGGARLEDLTPGTFSEVTFSLPPQVSAALSAIYNDLTLIVIINGPAMSAPVLLDNLQFEGIEVSVDTDVTAIPFLFELPESVGLKSVVVQASESLHLANGVHATNTTANVVNMGSGDTYIGVAAEIDGNVFAGGQTILDDRSKVRGFVQAGGIVDERTDVVVDGGSIGETPLTVGARYRWNADWPVVNGVFTVNDGDTLNLAPGNYTSVTINSRGVVNLTSGTYFFDNFVAHAGTTINITGDDTPVILYVRDSFTCRAALNHSRSSADFFVGFAGEGTVDLDGPFAGTVVAPNATIRFAPLNGGSHEGSFFAKNIWAEANTPIVRVPFDHWDWLMPPMLSVECISRAAKQHSAALFSYDNPLDYTVDILRGPRNDIVTQQERHAPLQRFEPGAHEKFYWIPFVGPQLCWTIDGNTVCADSNTRGCTLNDYANTVAKREIWPLSYSDSYPYLKPLEPVDGNWQFSAMADDDQDMITPDKTGFSDDNEWTFEVSGWYVADGWWDNLDLKIQFGDLSDTQDMCGKACDACSGSCPQSNRERTFVFDGDAKGPLNANDRIPFTVYIIEREYNEFGDDYNKLKVSGEISPDGTTIYFGGKEHSLFDEITVSDSGWQVYFTLIPPDPQFCVKWEVQFAGGIGEDDAHFTRIQPIHASFAYARLSIDNGLDSFSPWSGFYPLDEKGCIPQKYSPTRRQLIPDDTSKPVTVNLEVAGKHVFLDSSGNSDGTVWKVVDSNDEVFVINKTLALDDKDYWGFWGDIFVHLQNDKGKPYNNEFTKTAAIVSHVFKMEAEGRDMGIRESTMVIQANNSTKDYPFHDPQTGKIHLRKDGTGGVKSHTLPYGDASRKFSVTHEIGHGIQNRTVATFSSAVPGGYDVVMRDTAGNVHVYSEDDTDTANSTYQSLWGVEECRCYVSKNHSNMHCMQSLEMPNTGIGEGFANFYSAMVWNNPDEVDCKYGYPKSMYVPNCPENAVDCSVDDCTDSEVRTRCYDANQVIADSDPDVLDYMKGNDTDDTDYLPAKPEPGWKIVIGLSAVECNIDNSGAQEKWQRWRNKHCLDTDATEDLKQLAVEMDWTRFYSEL